MGYEPVQDALEGEELPREAEAGGVPEDVVRIIDADGHLLPGASEVDLTDEQLLDMYERLRLARRLDERAVSLQRQGRIATYAPLGGAEALQVAATMALEPHDWVYPTYRDHAAKVGHGVPLEDALATFRGVPGGNAPPDGVRVFPEAIPIASQLPHAVGAAMATDRDGEPDVHLAFHGDGATSEGDFHEALNFAGVFDAPVVFLCNNNQWAISVPVERQTASETLAQKAQAYGIDSVRVDGMDPLAVYRTVAEAVDHARSLDSPRPTLVEGVTYRMGAHTTADDPDVYREGVPDEWAELDPVPRLESFLRHTDRLDDERDEEIRERVEDRIAEAIEAVESGDVADPDRMFADVYDEPTPELRAQREELGALREEYGEARFRKEF